MFGERLKFIFRSGALATVIAVSSRLVAQTAALQNLIRVIRDSGKDSSVVGAIVERLGSNTKVAHKYPPPFAKIVPLWDVHLNSTDL